MWHAAMDCSVFIWQAMHVLTRFRNQIQAEVKVPLPMADQLGATAASVIALMGGQLDKGFQLSLDNF